MSKWLFQQVVMRLLLLFFCLAQLTANTYAVASNSEWRPDQFILKQGKKVPGTGGVTLVADDAGIIFIVLPTSGQSLREHTLLYLSLEGRSPQRTLVYWRREGPEQDLYNVEVRPPIAGTSTYELGAVPDWNGPVDFLGLALQTAPNQPISLRKVALSRPTLVNRVTMVFNNWRTTPPWRHTDINMLSGTVANALPPYPAPFFAAIAALGVALLWSIHRLSRLGASFSWPVAGCLVLAVWIVADVFWQARLWNQAGITWSTFAGKSSEQKLQVSQYAQLVSSIKAAKEQISEPDARVFIASAGDYVGMLSAYYMSPLNTFWHRKGPELPAGDDMVSGDYILLIAPTKVQYDLGTGIIHGSGDKLLKTRREFRNEHIILLRVI